MTGKKARKAAPKGASKVPGVPDKMLPEVERIARQRADARSKEPCAPGRGKKGKEVQPTCDTVEPARPRIRGLRRSRAAAVILAIVLVLGFANALSLVYEGMIYKPPSKILAETSGSVYGRVTDTKGVGIDGADVSIVGTTYKASTDADGWYFIGSVPPREYRVQADKANFTSIIKKVDVEQQMPRPVNFQLAEGSGIKTTETRLPDALGDLQPSYGVSAIGNVIGAVMAGMGAYLAYTRTRFRMAVLFAALGTLTYGFLLGTVLAVLAMFLLIIARQAFYPLGLAAVVKTRRAGDEDAEVAEELELEPSEEPEVRTLETRKAELEIGAAEGDAQPPVPEEPVIDAEVKEKLVAKGMESEGTVSDMDGEPVQRGKRRELKPVGPEVVGDMEKALKETMAAQEETETDIVASVLKKLDLDKPVPPVLPPPKEKPKPKKPPKAHEERLLCRVCVKPIIIEEEAIKCKCGRTYHAHCAKAMKECKNCGRKLKV